jgi:UDP-GlcNAc:undecaprenyl-phosphate GlcNAc-1-phosphate transferase
LAVLHAVLTFVLSFLVVAATTPLIRRYALQRKLGDKPNGRKIHTSMIPHLGGIGMVLGVSVSLAALTLLFVGTNRSVPHLFLDMLVPVGMIIVLGLADDTKNLRAHQKLFVQTAAALVVPFSGIHLVVGWTGFDNHLLLAILLTAFYLVGTSSSVNLIDGLDGLATGVSLISAVAFAVAATLVGSPALLWVSLALAGACVGFLIYNFPPGKIFMGDTGSLFLGIMLGILACSITMARPGVATFFGVSFVLAVPMLDSWLAIARRLALRRPVFEADHLHIHHILTSFGFSARQTLAMLCSMQALMAVLGILAVMGFILPVVAGVVFLALASSTFYRMMVVSKEKLAEPAGEFVRGSVPSLEK